jgi:hypothetical protein
MKLWGGAWCQSVNFERDGVFVGGFILRITIEHENVRKAGGGSGELEGEESG